METDKRSAHELLQSPSLSAPPTNDNSNPQQGTGNLNARVQSRTKSQTQTKAKTTSASASASGTATKRMQDAHQQHQPSNTAVVIATSPSKSNAANSDGANDGNISASGSASASGSSSGNKTGKNHHHRNKSVQSKIPPTKKDERKLFVGGLPQDVTAEEFRVFFAQFGTLMDAVVMFDRDTHRSRGFGFVTYVDPNVSKMLLDMQLNDDDTKGDGDGDGMNGGVGNENARDGASPKDEAPQNTNGTSAASGPSAAKASASKDAKNDSNVKIGRLRMRGKVCEIKAAQPKQGSGSAVSPSHVGSKQNTSQARGRAKGSVHPLVDQVSRMSIGGGNAGMLPPPAFAHGHVPGVPNGVDIYEYPPIHRPQLDEVMGFGTEHVVGHVGHVAPVLPVGHAYPSPTVGLPAYEGYALPHADGLQMPPFAQVPMPVPLPIPGQLHAATQLATPVTATADPGAIPMATGPMLAQAPPPAMMMPLYGHYYPAPSHWIPSPAQPPVVISPAAAATGYAVGQPAVLPPTVNIAHGPTVGQHGYNDLHDHGAPMTDVTEPVTENRERDGSL